VSAPVQIERCSETCGRKPGHSGPHTDIPTERDRERARELAKAIPLGMRRRVAVGTRVESRVRSVCGKDGQRRWARGIVVGHEPSLDLPLVWWDDERGLTPEAVTDDEFEVCG